MTEAVLQSTEEKKAVKIGDYVLTGKIGQGGIAEIFRGKQESLNRDVAIKILSTNLLSDADIVRRFEREAVVIGQLSHPNIVHVIDRGKAGNRYYFVMEYVDGTSLREVIDSPKIALETKLDMIVQVCKALDYAHKNGVIHRDIKPANILVDKQGNARVADFGIAQIVGTPDTEATSSEIVMGTLAYMSPEQKISTANVDQTTDIYAVGVMTYEILCGKKPQGHFKLPSEVNPKLSRGFDQIIIRCLSENPHERYQSAVALKDAILNELAGGRRQNADDYSAAGADSFIGKCQYLDTIRESQFSSTILVENKINKRLYVIKKHSKGEAGRKEAKLLTSLRHDNINLILGSGGDSKHTVVISEYAQGGSLADRMARKYDWQAAMAIVLQVAEGLDFAHKNNIVHGNLRPSNILFDTKETAKLTDFGMPSHYEGKRNWYAPPEHRASKQGDIYALGVILHQLLAGRTPDYDTNDRLQLADLYMQVPEALETMLTRLLAIRTVNRYKSCEEFAADWREYEKSREMRQARVEQMTPVTGNARPGVPTWVYAAVGGGIIAVAVLTLVLSGIF